MLLGHYEILGWLDPLHIVGKLKQAPGDALFQKISLDVIFLKNKFSFTVLTRQHAFWCTFFLRNNKLLFLHTHNGFCIFALKIVTFLFNMYPSTLYIIESNGNQ